MNTLFSRVSSVECREKKPLVLTIGGFDPSSGAGITLDLKVFQDLGVYGLSTISAITIQNSQGVSSIFIPPVDIFNSQLNGLMEDYEPKIIKVSLLPDLNIITSLNTIIASMQNVIIVVDPIIKPTIGTTFLDDDLFEQYLNKIISLAKIITPNIYEAEKISGIKIKTLEDIKNAAQIIYKMGPSFIVIKGGHFNNENNKVIDLIFDGSEFYFLENERLNLDVRGTGCLYSSAIASFIAIGNSELDAIKQARQYVQDKLSKSCKVGKGRMQV